MVKLWLQGHVAEKLGKMMKIPSRTASPRLASLAPHPFTRSLIGARKRTYITPLSCIQCRFAQMDRKTSSLNWMAHTQEKTALNFTNSARGWSILGVQVQRQWIKQPRTKSQTGQPHLGLSAYTFMLKIETSLRSWRNHLPDAIRAARIEGCGIQRPINLP